MIAWLKSKGVAVTAVETPGIVHTWLVWRNNLINFAPLLFQTAAGAASTASLTK